MHVKPRTKTHEGFCARLVDLRKTHGYSQRKLAELLGVSQIAIIYWEHGERIPNTIYLDDMARIFNVSMDYMWRGGE